MFDDQVRCDDKVRRRCLGVVPGTTAAENARAALNILSKWDAAHPGLAGSVYEFLECLSLLAEESMPKVAVLVV